MNKSNDSSKLGRAPQTRELRDDELQEVSGGLAGEDVSKALECFISAKSPDSLPRR